MHRKSDISFWLDPYVWREANLSLYLALQALSGANLERARHRARSMEALLEFSIPVMEELCEKTCPACPDPCCARAQARFHVAELLFLHLAEQPVPLAQTGPVDRAGCRYLGNQGCLLPHLSRPWICRWYLCPEQKRLVQHFPESGQRRFELALERIRKLRRDLMAGFIGAVSRDFPMERTHPPIFALYPAAAFWHIIRMHSFFPHTFFGVLLAARCLEVLRCGHRGGAPTAWIGPLLKGAPQRSISTSRAESAAR
ncbi:MAG: hypothetical protein V5B78_09970 [Desulfohalobiaceae bacterium]